MKKGVEVLKDYVRRSAKIVVVTGKLDPKKRSKAQKSFIKKLSPVINDNSKSFEDLTKTIEYKEKFFSIAYPKLELDEEDISQMEGMVQENIAKLEAAEASGEGIIQQIDQKNFLAGCIMHFLQNPRKSI